jgi:hypothetical protein
MVPWQEPPYRIRTSGNTRRRPPRAARSRRSAAVLSLLAGTWLVISPFILAAKFAVSAPMYWSNGFGALAVMLFALAASLRRRTAVVR